MNPSTPSALILGINHFVARKLMGKILANDINVIGVGDFVAGVSENENVLIKNDLSEVIDRSVNYIFDFVGSAEVWKKAETDGAKLVVICVNDKGNKKRLEEELAIWTTVNWRIVEAYGVYGPEMPEEGFLTGALRQSVENKNLILPSLSLTYRLLSVDDLVEAILRSIFLSGTEGEDFLIVGTKTNSEEVARVLIDEAKMTRFKVMQSEINLDHWPDQEVEHNWKRLRWQPEISFKDGIKETLQYFFSKIDEEKRKNKDKNNFEIKKEKLIEKLGQTPLNPPLIKGGHHSFEVVVEEKTPESDVVVPASKKNEEEKEQIPLDPPLKKGGSLEMIEEEYDDIKPLKSFKAEVREHIVEKTPLPAREIEVIEEEEVETPKKELALLSVKTTKKKIKKSKKWLMMVLFMVFCLALVPINWILTGFTTVNSIKKVEVLIKNKEYVKAELMISKSNKSVKKIDTEIDDLGLNKFELARNYQTILRVMEDVLTLESKTIDLMTLGDKFSGAVFKEKEIDWYKELDLTKTKLDEVTTDLGLLQARLNGNWNWAPGVWRSTVQKESRQLDEVRQQLELSKKAIAILPSFLGIDGKEKDYMILFQNENEIRATGGFIGSYGILSFKGGKLTNMEIKDIYEADGQLKGHVEPPEELKTYLGEAGWFMRDANWQASFPAAAADIQWFYNKEVGKKVDGIIGINLAVVKSMLGVVGEVAVPDFKEKINKDNLYEQAEFYAETKFFPGSNQKASFLGGLGKQLFEEIKILKPEQQGQLLIAMLNMLEKNEVQIELNDKTAALVVADLGWDGSIYQGKCANARCLSDYLFVVESNLGVNKANYFLYRNMEQVIDISTTEIKRTLKISYENTSKSTNWPGGDYKNYVRIYLPVDVNLNEVSLIDGDNPNSKKIYSSEEIKIGKVEGKKELGLLVTVPTASKRVLELKYVTPVNLIDKKDFSYLYYIQKQSGFGETGLVTLISFPQGWQPMQVQPAANLVGGRLLFNQKLDRDIKMGVELGK